MKKALTVLVLLLLLCTSVFASRKVTATFAPYAFQNFVQKTADTKNAINTKYGIGGGIGCKWESDKNYMFGADIKVATYVVSDQKNFTDISFLAKAGYIAFVRDDVSLYGNLKAGLDIQTHNNKASAVFEFGPELEVEYKLNDRLDLIVSCEALFGFPKSNDAKYSEFRATPTIGVGYSF